MVTATSTDQRFPLRRIVCGHGEMAWREAGSGAPLVLLHGIGSGSGSWNGQLEALSAHYRVIAWDAPGYGGSAPLANPRPLARDYAAALADWLGRLGIDSLTLVGHSLGAMMAAAFAAQASERVRALALASPARGYASAPPETREAKYRERIDLVERLGVEGMANARAARLVSPAASAEAIENVRANMARCTPGGYAQAAYLLAHDDITAYLTDVRAPLAVLCGSADGVTPPAGCEALAAARHAPFTLLPGLGHACYVEDAAAVNRVLLAFFQHTQGAARV